MDEKRMEILMDVSNTGKLSNVSLSQHTHTIGGR